MRYPRVVKGSVIGLGAGLVSVFLMASSCPYNDPCDTLAPLPPNVAGTLLDAVKNHGIEVERTGDRGAECELVNNGTPSGKWEAETE